MEKQSIIKSTIYNYFYGGAMYILPGIMKNALKAVNFQGIYILAYLKKLYRP